MTQETRQDPLAECLTQVLRPHDLRPDVAGLKALLPRPAGNLTTDDLTLLCERLNLTLDRVESPLSSARTLEHPVIVTDLKGDAPRVLFPARTGGKQRWFIPGVGMRTTSETDFSGESACFLRIRPREESTEATLEHMRHQRPIDWFWTPLRVHWKRFAEVLACSVFINLFVLLIPIFTLNVYDSVIPNFATETLAALTVGVIMALLFDFVLKTIRIYILEYVAARVGGEFDGTLMERLLLINGEHMRLSIGERANLFRELQGIREFYASRLLPTAVDLPFFVLFMIVMFMISPVLVWVPVVAAVVIIGLNAAIQVPINRATLHLFSTTQKKSTLMMEMLTGTSTFKLFNAIGSRLYRWSSVAEHTAQAGRLSQFLLGVVQNLSLTAVNIVNVVIVVVGVYEIHEGKLTVGGLIACTILAGRAIAPIVNLGAVVSRWQQSRDVLIALDGVFKLPHEGQQAMGQAMTGDTNGGIEVRGLTYSYPQQRRPALTGVTLAFKPGEHVGLIGQSGAGKSTLAGLLSGMMHGYEGNISVDGIHLDELAPARLREIIAFVPQFPFFVDGTIRDNVLLGSEDASDEALHEALAVSGLDVVLRQAGYALDTPVGEGGSRLSGGQRQAVSIARAIVRNPRVLVVDEPATGLDAMLETRLRGHLSTWLKDRTYIMVTHRTTLLDLVDRLVMLDNGRVVADGPKNAVLAKIAGVPANKAAATQSSPDSEHPVRH
jgi:ATP-binding cassette subfamily B protein/ATP-binding cassette subfamily C protein LapB